MTRMQTFATTALTTLSLAFGSAGLALAQAPAADPHHPTDQAPAATQPAPMPPGPRPMPPGQRPMARGPMQPAGPGMMGPGMMGPGMMMGGDMPQMMQMMRGMMMMQAGMGPAGMMPFRHVEGHLAFLKAELHITDAQAPQWTAFADAMRNQATAMQAAMQAMPLPGGPVAAPDRMERHVAVLSARLDAMKAILAATKPLYAVLSDEQKKTADELMAGPMMGMRPMGPWAQPGPR